YLNPLRPIMDWEDPQAGARRILSACAIRRIGTQGATLLGIQTRALHGLNPGTKPDDANPEPALSAAVSIGREVRRYGAWAWLEDEFSLPQTLAFLRQGPDFALDTVSSPGAEHALLTGNAELVRFMYDQAGRIGLDQHRLVRRLPDERGLSYALPHLCSLGNTNSPFTPAQIREQARLSGGAWAGSTLYAGSAGLAALALREDSSSPAAKTRIRQGQTLLLFFKAMQPGLFMLPARDLLGTLPLDGKQGRRPPPGNEPSLAMHGAYNLLSTADDAPAGKSGLPRANVLYPPLDVQEMRPAENFLQSVGEILRVRKQTGIAAGRFVTRLPTKNPGSIALLFALPGAQGAVLTICNFSRAGSHESLNLGAPEVQPFAKGGIRHIWGAPAEASSVNLGPWQGTAFLLGKTSDKNTGGLPSHAAAAPDPKAPPANASKTAAPEAPYTPGIQDLKKGETSYVVQPGNQLHAIAARYKVTPEAIMERNNIPSSDLIVEGRMLIIPAPGTVAAQAALSPPQQGKTSPLPQPSHTLQDEGSGSFGTKKHSEIPLQDEEQRYVVQSGDVLGRIAARHNLRPEAIARRNNLSSSDRLVIGQTLVIPASGAVASQTAEATQVPRTPSASPNNNGPVRTEENREIPLQDEEQRYVVQKGDRLDKIAAQYNVRPQTIVRRNKLPSPNHIVIGQTLVIPAPEQ
ncbi:MAG: LysM peptidoglycan-binding domain-containing protein, partial [Desulfovibrionaceae bacterium]|nr:LysM peptidoglycan-binding domain-containing protein [Desulfovibrionaceae bacterium]